VYDRPTQDQPQAIRRFVLGSVMLPTGSGKLLCYASLQYIFDSLWQSIGEGCLQRVVSTLLTYNAGSKLIVQQAKSESNLCGKTI